MTFLSSDLKDFKMLETREKRHFEWLLAIANEPSHQLQPSYTQLEAVITIDRKGDQNIIIYVTEISYLS